MAGSGFILDYSKCVGCHACIVACYNENKTNPPISWRQINSFNTKKIPLAGFLNLSIACNHCTDAPCIKACPANAYSIDNTIGAVIHNPEKCIGCKYCIWACPFDAPKYNKSKGIVEKCHLCNQLISKGLIPACAKQCPTGALSYEVLNIDLSDEQFGIPSTNYNPRIRTINTSIDHVSLINKDVSGFEEGNIITEKKIEKVKVSEEWPLALFTLIFSFLVGWYSSFWMGFGRSQQYTFIILGIIGILLRACLNFFNHHSNGSHEYPALA